jgi:hypothetical protein
MGTRRHGAAVAAVAAAAGAVAGAVAHKRYVGPAFAYAAVRQVLDARAEAIATLATTETE